MTRFARNISLLVAALFVFFGMSEVAQGQNDLTGSYQLDVSRSENVADIIESATRNTNTSSANKQDLERKLEAPETIALDIRGNEVTLSTSRSSNPVRFVADGTARTSTRADGSTIQVRAALRRQTLTIASIGGETDYTLTFVSLDNGKTMRVTRRITTEYLRQTVFADSYYDKTDTSARLGTNTSRNPDDDQWSSTDPNDRPSTSGNAPRVKKSSSGRYIVDKGTVLTGTLENRVSTKASQNNDRFAIQIQSPNEYDGAVVEGYLSDVKRSGRVTGRSTFTMNFETIRMPNGQVYDFAGVLKSATDSTGKVIRTGKEGETKGGSKTKESIKRGGIGAGIGAILGGIFGGGKGAIIGATIGGGVGTGSVIAQGKGDVELDEGSTVTVESTSN